MSTHLQESLPTKKHASFIGGSCLNPNSPWITKGLKGLGFAISVCGFAFGLASAAPQVASKRLEITRTVRPWEFLSVTGRRAGILGNESGRVEAWVYPLKLLRNLSLTFHFEGHALQADTLARTITVRPESTTIQYTGDTFRVRETFFVPVDEPGAIIRLEVETEKPLEIEASFQKDFQLEWPAGLGGTYLEWNAELHAFVFGEESHRFAGIVGAPTMQLSGEEFETNYASSNINSMKLGITTKGKDTKFIFIAGSMTGFQDAKDEFRKLSEQQAQLQETSAKYYLDYLQRTVQLELPDAQLQQAYDWSRISILQGVVRNPYLGTGLVAGYRTSGQTQRPGFAWYFGRDSLWTSFALNSEGDYATTREALTFVLNYQREDGKIPHEIAQGASFVNWFKDYPYGFASADATPLFLIATEDYVKASGDTAFAKDHWAALWKVYTFLKSTYDESGFPRNIGIGHGWVEGGPLLPVKTELYQSGLGTAALHSLAEIAKLTGHDSESKTLAAEYEIRRKALNDIFWSPEKNSFAFALDSNGNRVDTTTVLTTAPMWFDVFDEKKSVATINELAGFDHQTDWGIRIISNQHPFYSGGGYHFGSVWPLFTGWASVAGYKEHRVAPGYANLRENALLALDGASGHVTEVLSGDYYQSLSTSSPHQIWSAAMVVSPLLRGMMGLKTEALTQTISLAPSLPAKWNSFAIKHVEAGRANADIFMRRTPQGLFVNIRRTGSGECTFVFEPVLSLRAEISSVELNARPVPFRLQANANDQHLQIRVGLSNGENTLRVRSRHDFAITYTGKLPPLGEASQGLRIISESWSAAADSLSVQMQGAPGKTYELSVFNPAEVVDVEGGTMNRDGEDTYISVEFAKELGKEFTQKTLVIHFAQKKQ